jgi:hypothetical protein
VRLFPFVIPNPQRRIPRLPFALYQGTTQSEARTTLGAPLKPGVGLGGVVVFVVVSGHDLGRAVKPAARIGL